MLLSCHCQSAGPVADCETSWSWRNNQGIFSQAVPRSPTTSWTAACGQDIFLPFFASSVLNSTFFLHHIIIDLNNKMCLSVFQSSSPSSGSPVQRRSRQPRCWHQPSPSSSLFHSHSSAPGRYFTDTAHRRTRSQNTCKNPFLEQTKFSHCCIFQVLSCLLQEQRIVFFSSDWARLTLVAESLLLYLQVSVVFKKKY